MKTVERQLVAYGDLQTELHGPISVDELTVRFQMSEDSTPTARHLSQGMYTAAVAALIVIILIGGVAWLVSGGSQGEVISPTTVTTAPPTVTTTIPESAPPILTTPISAGGVIEWSRVDRPPGIGEIVKAEVGFVDVLGRLSSLDGRTWESGAFALPSNAGNVGLAASDSGLLAIGVKTDGLGVWRLENGTWQELEVVAPEMTSLQSAIGSAWTEGWGLLRAGEVITVLARYEGSLVTQAVGRVSGDRLLPVEVPWLDVPRVDWEAWILEFEDRFVALAVGSRRLAWESTDAITWRPIDLPPFFQDCLDPDCGVDFTGFLGGQAFPQREGVLVNPASVDESSFTLWRSEDGFDWIDVAPPTPYGGLWAADSFWVYGLTSFNDPFGINPMWVSIDGMTWDQLDISEIAEEVHADPCYCIPAEVAGDTIFIHGNDFLWVGTYRP